MPRYWIMRVDHHEAKNFLWSELKAGRLRQGWGYREDQNLETIAARRKKGAPITDEQQDAWRGNRRMLGSEPDSIQEGDVILVPHFPGDRHWSIARVLRPYHRAAVENALEVKFGKLKEGGGEALLKALSDGIENGTFKYVGQGTLKKGLKR